MAAIDLRTTAKDEFAEKFRELADLMLDALSYGPNSCLESQYSATRQWLMTHYIQVKQTLRPHLPANVWSSFSVGMLDMDAMEGFLHFANLASVVNLPEKLLRLKIAEVQQGLNGWMQIKLT